MKKLKFIPHSISLIAGLLLVTSSGYSQSPGALDPSFNIGAGPTNEVRAVAAQTDGKFIIGGRFASFDGQSRNGIARVNADGTLDATFNPGTGISGSEFGVGVYAVAVQSDGKIVIAGSFDSVNGAAHANIARLNADGSVDASFNANTNQNPGNAYILRAVAVQGDGKILLGGNFTTVNGVARANVARVNPDGSLDTGFNAGGVAGDANGEFVAAIGIKSNGKIVLGGKMASNNVLRLNADGSPDPGFDISNSPDNTVYALAIQSDGKIVIGGTFSEFGDSFRFSIARTNADGTLDTTYKPNLGTGNFDVLAIGLQADGKAIVGGEGSDNTLPGIARINPDGSIDTTYVASIPVDGSAVEALVVIPSSNKTLIGGRFGTVDGAAANSVALLIGGAAASAHPFFFSGEVSLGNGIYYLALPNGQVFGYYAYLSDPRFIFHLDMGYLYWFDGADAAGSIYFYDFTSDSFFYTSRTFSFPYLYDFKLQAFLYYYPDANNPGRYTTNPRYFFNFSTNQIITK